MPLSDWSFQSKLVTGVILICLLAILTSGASLVVSRTLIADMTRVETTARQERDAARVIQLEGLRSIAAARACLLIANPAPSAIEEARGVLLTQDASRMRTRIVEPRGRALLDSVLVHADAHGKAFEQLMNARARLGVARSAQPEAVLAQDERLELALSVLVDHFEALRLAELATSRAPVDRARTMLVVIIIATILLLTLGCLALIMVLGRSYRRQSSARDDAEQGQTQARTELGEAEAASHMKDEFLATVSHELRNPLAPILTWTQLLRGGTLDAEKTQRALEVIERSVLSQAQLIDDLVDVSRVVSGKFRLDVRPLDLVPVIRAAAESLMPASEAKRIRLQLVLDERAGMISGDSERIQQVMWNLIANGIKFTPKGGRVQIVLQRVESHLEIIVSDSGIGVDPEFLPHIFEPFQQGVGGSMRRHGGLGLGLSIVRHIVELHGGEIVAQSAGLDRGSKFTVKFPLLATTRVMNETVQRHPVARDTLSEVHHGRLDGVRVLVVDDEPNASEALVVLFASCGADARAAGSAAQALEMFAVWRPDILVSDIAMPGEDGYSLIRRLRQRSASEGGNVPALALTAYAKTEDRVSILAAGFQMYLSKPANPTELVAVVVSLVHGRAHPAPVLSS